MFATECSKPAATKALIGNSDREHLVGHAARARS